MDIHDHLREAEKRIAYAIGRELFDLERRFGVRPTALSIGIADAGLSVRRPLYFVERCHLDMQT